MSSEEKCDFAKLAMLNYGMIGLLVAGGISIILILQGKRPEMTTTYAFVLLACVILAKYAYAEKKKMVERLQQNGCYPGDSVSEDGGMVEGFSVTPHVMDDYKTNVVSPMFAEERQVLPPIHQHEYDVYQDTNYQTPENLDDIPYGQYITRTNLIPGDEQAIRHLNGKKDAREYIHSRNTEHDLQFREGMVTGYKRRLDHRFHQNFMHDTYSPFQSY